MIFKWLFGQQKEISKKDYYDYEVIPRKTRKKIYYVIAENAYHYSLEAIGHGRPRKDFKSLRYQIAKHLGEDNINQIIDNQESIDEWLKSCSMEHFIRSIEIFLWIKNEDDSSGSWNRKIATINDINDIFEIDRIGYEIIENKIHRKDSQFLHDDVVKESITLLYNNDFKGSLEEFNDALEYYGKKDYKNTILYANKSFESTMKSVLSKLNINYNSKNANASKLIQLLYDNDILFSHTQNFTNNLKTILSGLPSIRNNQAGHGQGLDPQKVNKSYAQFSIHLAGSFIVFLVNRYEELK